MTGQDFALPAVVDTAARFARVEVAGLVGTEGRDGRLERLDSVLDKAEAAGLLASPQLDSPGYDYGVWGRTSVADGPAASLAVLEAVAAECAGVAACLHFAGLGALFVDPVPEGVSRTAVAFLEHSWRLTGPSLATPPTGATRLERRGGETRLSGAKSLVLSPPSCQGFVVVAASDSAWHQVFARLDAPGVTRTDPGQRTGLAAVEAHILAFDDVAVEAAGPTDPAAWLSLHLLGISAIALGNARGAHKAAAAYARERVQGGAPIAEHPAVRLLLGGAIARIDAAEAHVAIAAANAGSSGGLRQAIACRLAVTTGCSQAVSDCLQVLGGYGYMEEYRLEKRLRDALTLKSLAPRLDDLRLMLADPRAEVGR